MKQLSRRAFVQASGIAGAAALLTLAGCNAESAPTSGGQKAAQLEQPTQPEQPAVEAAAPTATYDSTFPAHAPLGQARGIMPGRVVWAHDPASVLWDGSGEWWRPENYDEAVVRRMVDAAVASVAGASSPLEGWRALFASVGDGAGYAPGRKVAIKCNLNGAAEYDDDTTGTSTGDLYTNPVLLKCLIASLVEAGVAPGDITAYDTTRIFPDYLKELCAQGPCAGVHFADRNEGNPGRVQADVQAPIVWSGPVNGETCYLPTCVTGADYLINFADLKGHDYGITLCAKNHFGSFCNSSKMRQPQQAGLHPFLSGQRMGDYSSLVDLMGSAHLGGKTILCILGALVAPARNTSAVTPEISQWTMEPFSGGFTASVFMSQDPVAIDSVGADFLMNEPAMTGNNAALEGNAGCENYLHEAALAAAPPSGAAYGDGSGGILGSLGVHEHWDNAVDKRYSRNRGSAEGIELVRV